MGRAIPFNNLGEGLCLCLHRYPTSMHSCSMGPTGTQNPWTIGLIMCMPIHQWCGTDSWELYKTGYSLLGEPASGTTTYTGAYRAGVTHPLAIDWEHRDPELLPLENRQEQSILCLACPGSGHCAWVLRECRCRRRWYCVSRFREGWCKICHCNQEAESSANVISLVCGKSHLVPEIWEVWWPTGKEPSVSVKNYFSGNYIKTKNEVYRDMLHAFL